MFYDQCANNRLQGCDIVQRDPARARIAELERQLEEERRKVAA